MEDQEWKKEVVKEAGGVKVVGSVTVKVRGGQFEIEASGEGSPRVSCKRATEEEMWVEVERFEAELLKDLDGAWNEAKTRAMLGERMVQAGFTPYLGRT